MMSYEKKPQKNKFNIKKLLILCIIAVMLAWTLKSSFTGTTDNSFLVILLVSALWGMLTDRVKSKDEEIKPKSERIISKVGTYTSSFVVVIISLLVLIYLTYYFFKFLFAGEGAELFNSNFPFLIVLILIFISRLADKAWKKGIISKGWCQVILIASVLGILIGFWFTLDGKSTYRIFLPFMFLSATVMVLTIKLFLKRRKYFKQLEMNE
ncbi:MAG: hypothetical protein LBV19_04870 [Streptococcaceae bacterium]|jgi:uncharacterized membrane protein YfcA|nr:hypothetical protein [Streptococcaceae bacterium]